jgi:hypothetical protein
MRSIAGLQGNEQGNIIPVQHLEALKKLADVEKTGLERKGRYKRRGEAWPRGPITVAQVREKQV